VTSKSERDDLARVIKLRAKVAREGITQREAELLADMEDQRAAKYKFDHKLWADITAAAQEAIAEADAKIAQICRESGLHEDFRPKLSLSWYNRGENALADRRAELRRVAQTRIAAVGKAAKTAISAQEANLLTAVIADGLTSEQARNLLESMPTVEWLMPQMNIAELEDARGRRG
jgi:hypothetical protein